MSLKKVGHVKADRGFKLWDLAIYGAIILICAAVFLAVFLTRDNSPLTGFKVFYADEVIYEYDFNQGEINRASVVETIFETSDKLTLKVSLQGVGYNIIEINKGGSVRVAEADCAKHDCVYTPEIKDCGGIIYCSPHKLKIVPYDFDIDGGNITV